jgi:hypothetical protein
MSDVGMLDQGAKSGVWNLITSGQHVDKLRGRSTQERIDKPNEENGTGRCSRARAARREHLDLI